jgi:hypothetical protein
VLHEPGFTQEIRRLASARFSGQAYIDYFRDMVVASS